MSAFAELILKRRSVRQYTDEPLNPADVKQIMRAALLSPTSKNSRAWEFILVEDKTLLKQLSFSKPTGAVFVENCALAIVVVIDTSQSEAYLEDTAITATFMQLQAEDLDLGSCWVQIHGRQTASGLDSEQYLRELLNIPSHYAVGCIIAIGHKVRESKPHNEEKLLWEKLHINQFG